MKKSYNNSELDLIFIRYCPGSCGNFLISILSISPKTAHWDTEIEKSKTLDEFDDIYKSWFKSKFQPDLHRHLQFEPHHPYKLDFVSAKHSRGDELTLNEFLKHLAMRDDRHFFDAINDQKKILLRLNKSIIPKWGAGSSVINIFIDPPSYKWIHRCRAVKLFGLENTRFISKENHPDFLKYKFDKIQFDNQYLFNLSKIKFLKELVIKEPVLETFKSQHQICEHVTNQSLDQQTFINLSDFFQWESFERMIADLYDRLNLGSVNKNLVYHCWHHYYQTNIKPILEKKIEIFPSKNA